MSPMTPLLSTSPSKISSMSQVSTITFRTQRNTAQARVKNSTCHRIKQPESQKGRQRGRTRGIRRRWRVQSRKEKRINHQTYSPKQLEHSCLHHDQLLSYEKHFQQSQRRAIKKEEEMHSGQASLCFTDAGLQQNTIVVRTKWSS